MEEVAEGDIGNLIAVSSSSDNEVLVLPSSYVPRRVMHFAPESSSIVSTTAATSSSRQSPETASHGQVSTTTSTATLSTVLKEVEILSSPQRSQLSFLYALPGSGSTSLMYSLIVQIQQFYPDRWVSYMDLRKVAVFMQKQASPVDEKEWTMASLISAYNKISDPSSLQQIQNFFQRTNEGNSIEAELFLDEFDEISPKMQTLLLDIIARDIPSTNCQTRLWISSKYHLKLVIQKSFPSANEYELLPLLRVEQIKLLASYWRITHPNISESKLLNFACGLHDHMEKLIPSFYKTLGACPSHLLQLPEFFDQIVTKLEENTTTIHFSTMDISVTKMFEKFVNAKFEAYVDQISLEQSALAMSSMNFRNKELRKLERIHMKTIITSYPSFECKPDQIFAGYRDEQLHALYRAGICYEKNGTVFFLHKMYGEFIAAVYFVDSGRVKNINDSYISFFLNKVLFKDDCKTIRMFFDSYLKIQQQERRRIREIVWKKLRCFLTQHYRLNDESSVNLSTSEEETAADVTSTEAKGKEQNVKLTYEDIKNNGSILHLLIMQGSFQTLRMIIDSFKGFPEDLKKLLSIKVPLIIYHENPNSQPNWMVRADEHAMDVFQMLAMYNCCTENLAKFVHTWFTLFGDAYMKKYFEDGTWTVLHFAGMNSSSNFLHTLFSKVYKPEWGKTQVQVRNPEGQQPTHMILSKYWYYTIKIRDHLHPDLQSCKVTATSSAAPKVTVIQEVINDVSTGNVTSNAPQVASSSTSPNGTSIISSKKRPRSGESSPPSSSGKKCKTTCQKLLPRASPAKIIDPCADFEDIWCFDGVYKPFAVKWVYYPEEVERSSLQPHLDALTLLLENGGDVNSRDDKNGNTILHQAVDLGNDKLVQFLLENGADVNAQDEFGRVPAHLAAFHGHTKVLEALAGQIKKENDGFGN